MPAWRTKRNKVQVRAHVRVEGEVLEAACVLGVTVHVTKAPSLSC